MPRPPVRWVQDPSQWRVLLAPARLEIVQALRCIGPCAVAELAAMVDRPADLLYRQLVLLERAEFVTQAGTRKRGRHSERLYDVTADDFALGFRDLSDDDAARTLTQTVRTFCHAGAKEVETSIKAGAIKLGEGQNMVVNYELSWLTPEQFQAARTLLYQVKQLLDAARPKRQGRPFVFVSVATPVTRRTRRKAVISKDAKSKLAKARAAASSFK